jgi:hypothetical protein
MPQNTCQLLMPHEGIQLTGQPGSPVKGGHPPPAAQVDIHDEI